MDIATKATDIGFIVDADGCSRAENKPLEAGSAFQTEPDAISAALLCEQCRIKWLSS